MNYESSNQAPDMENQQSQDTEQQEGQIDAELQNKNIAEDLSEDKLTEIGTLCKKGFETDLNSRSEWDKEHREWINLAKQLREPKTYPWPNASNVKYPLLSTAAMQFAARAYPSLVPSNGQVVKSVVIGDDPTGEKLEKAERVSKYMSYQVMHDMCGWDEDMDRMLMMLPVVGTIFKKTYYDKVRDKITSRVILPEALVVNYWTRNLEECERISEIIQLSKRLLQERINVGIYKDVDLADPALPINQEANIDMVLDDTTPYELIEQHTFLNIKDDKYAHPYIVTFERVSGKVLRIQNRYHKDGIDSDEKGKILRIEPIQSYTKFGFVPNPDGSFYDIGFGVLLGPLNESVNTIINQLLDAGHLSTLQAGFIGKGLRMKMGDSSFLPGEWKPVAATGDDLRKQIVPLPTKEPSNVLFELMGTLITSGKELASVAEIFVGKMPGQNTPATTTMASIEQGMKVFTAVYKRIFRSLSEEFKKIFELNGIYLDPNQYSAIIDGTIGPEDFNDDDYDICPGADPTAVSQTEKLLKAQGLMEIMQSAPGMLDPIKVISRILEAQEQPNWQQLFTQQVQQTGQYQPPPDPKMMAIQGKMQADQQTAATDIQTKQQEMELNARDKQQQMIMAQQEHAQKMQNTQQEAQSRAASDIAMLRIRAATEQAKTQQSLEQNQQMHEQKIIHQKEQTKLLPKQVSNKKNGSATRAR